MLAEYLNFLTLQGFRPQTIRVRKVCLESFERQLSRPLREATRTDVEAFLARPLAPASRRAYRAHLRGMYAWAVDRELIAKDPTEKIPTVKVPRGIPRPISDDDLHYAVAMAPRRIRVWLLLMALAGLRAIEVANLQPTDLLQTDAGVLLFLRECKGGGTATMPAHPVLVEELLALPVRNGTWWSTQPKQVSRQVNAYLRSRGIDATGHQLRHHAATAWYRASGHDLLLTARLLRHASVQSTQIYAQLDPARPAEVVALIKPP